MNEDLLGTDFEDLNKWIKAVKLFGAKIYDSRGHQVPESSLKNLMYGNVIALDDSYEYGFFDLGENVGSIYSVPVNL